MGSEATGTRTYASNIGFCCHKWWLTWLCHNAVSKWVLLIVNSQTFLWLREIFSSFHHFSWFVQAALESVTLSSVPLIPSLLGCWVSHPFHLQSGLFHQLCWPWCSWPMGSFLSSLLGIPRAVFSLLLQLLICPMACSCFMKCYLSTS